MEPSPATSPPWPPYPSPWRSTGRCHSCLCSMWDSLVPRQTSLFPNPDYLSLLRGLTPPTSTSRFTQNHRILPSPPSGRPRRSPTVSVPAAHCRPCLVDLPPFLRSVGQNPGSPYIPGCRPHGYSPSHMGPPILLVRHPPGPSYPVPCSGQVPPVSPEHILQREHAMASRPGPASPLSACIYSAHSSSPNPSQRMRSYGARNAPGAVLRSHRHFSSIP